MLLESDEPITYEENNTTICAKKNASLHGNDFLLLADEISWNRKSGEAKAAGSVSLTQGNFRVLADEVYFNTLHGNIMAKNCKGGSPPYYFFAESMERNESIDVYHGGQIYLSEPGIFEPNLKTNIFIIDGNTSTFKVASTQLRLGRMPVGILPGFSGINTSGFFGSSFGIKAGKDSNLGWYGETEYTYSWEKVSSDIKVTYYENRGTLVSPQIGFNNLLEDEFINSQIKGGWINDRATSMGNDNRNILLDRNRGHLSFESIARFKNRWRTSTLIEWESDSEMIRDFKRDYFSQNQWNQSHNELSYEGNGYTISILSRWQTNNHEKIVENIPMLNIDAGPNYVDVLNIYQTSSLNHTNLRTKDQFGKTGHSIQRMNVGYKAEKPFQFFGGLSLNPSIAWLHQDYQLQDGSEDRSFYEYGVDVQGSLYQVFPYENNIWEIEKLLHLMKGSVALRCTENLNRNNLGNIPEIYPNVEDLNLNPLDLLDHRNYEIINEKRILRFGWENVLLAKWKNRSRQLLSMRTFYDLRIDNLNGIDDGDFLFSDISVYPSNWLSLNFRNKINTQSSKNYRSVYSLSLKDGRFQGADLGYIRYLAFNNYSYLSAWKRLNEKLFTSASTLYDLDHNYFTYWNGKLRYRLGDSWEWDFSVSQRKGTLRENNIEWSIGFSLIDF